MSRLARVSTPAMVTLAGYRSALQAQHDQLQAIVDKLAPLATPAARSGRLTALHGLRTVAARLQWVDEVAALLEEDLR